MPGGMSLMSNIGPHEVYQASGGNPRPGAGGSRKPGRSGKGAIDNFLKTYGITRKEKS